MKKIIDNKLIGNVKIYKNEMKSSQDYEAYKNMFNSKVFNEGNEDEYVLFNTINYSKTSTYKTPIKPKKINTIWKVTQLNQWGEFCCDLGFFESKEKAIKQMFKGLSIDYRGFKKEVHFDGKQWHCERYDFIIDISEINFNVYGEV